MAKQLFVFLYLLLFSITTIAQRRLPYPIILVHGWGGDETSFKALFQEFSRIGLRVSYDPLTQRAIDGSRIDFCLNADGSLYRSNLLNDVRDLGSYIKPDNDVFAINFNNCDISSTQSAAVKQGYALGIAIDRVLQATGASKVILFGHSMGGLAIREYYQNARHWRTNNHRIAQIITVGTPHGGSNSNSLGLVAAKGFLEWSEAVRDLRWPNGYSIFDRGVYLYGGRENNMKRLGLYDYPNTDVNCDGNEDDNIVGLNRLSIETTVPFSCIIGIRGNLMDDLIVDADRANVNNLYVQRFATEYYANSNSMEAGTPTGFFDTWHSQLLYQKAICIQALDEPERFNQAFDVDFSRQFTSFFQRPNNNSGGTDNDAYHLWVPQRGILTITGNTFSESNASVDVFTDVGYINGSSFSNGSVVHQAEVSMGNHYIRYTGTAGNVVWRTYFHSYSFCPLPDRPMVSASGATTLCQGQSVNLATSAGYDTYQWFRNGLSIANNTPSLSTTEPGVYTVEGLKCGNTYRSLNSQTVIVNLLPATPIISIAVNGVGLQSSSSEGNQWYIDGKPIAGQTNSILPFSFLSGGSRITVQVTRSGCSAESAPFIVTDLGSSSDSIIKVYPNPTTNTVTVEIVDANPTTVHLYDITGQLVLSQLADQKQVILNVNTISAGVYFVSVPDRVGLVRLIKQ